ncbi:type II secretion system protein [Leifsonia sp. TF02-11]|uniref:type II secretion system protein n=1 Tax=Leifsonia sp. TF02-11 TaxID=2815212 RepID=UPI001AA16D24|nr:prepilin-type N-terminal cleavage/methylation domain-containing protein [Leifsonia sp. TF02-11]MBO1740300.1 type II secretion system protein [Leifsonia sp. TF02-11]
MIPATVRRIRGDERGITLVELIVAIGLLGIFVTILSSLYISSIQAMAVGRDVHGNTAQASNAINEITRVIRAGTDNPVQGQSLNNPAFEVAMADRIRIYAYINLNGSSELPVMIELSVSNGNLIEKRWAASQNAAGYWLFPASTTTPTSTRTIASYVVPNTVGGGTQLFTFIQTNNTAITIPTGPNGITDPTTLRSIAAVQVALTVRSSATDASQQVTVTNTVGIPNLGLARTMS